jgi:hypothetical protein
MDVSGGDTGSLNRDGGKYMVTVILKATMRPRPTA